ncbi:hypothetical protein J4N45_10320 [Vibrio sp. SCSIO 43140]|uniref:ParM/StbA family protein n=1 Tax=Vibrio sp. SCSIO 43140 TaxID=2819100 RepID=UPI002075DDD8|nr:hypothetical protein [Vibrio sp. SCSIO 43140]USD58924.1 hypothetical protein J4N45_10320 [Vibrio sp. SCSIO 43140]
MKRMMEIAAIDVGFGTTCIASNVSKNDQEFVVFPSRVRKVDPTKKDQIGSLEGIERETTVVKVDDTYYEVGPGVVELASNEEERLLSKRYIHSPEYKAYFLAALHQLKSDSIDLMVGGLPLNMLNMKQSLVEFMEGEHQVGGRTITIKKAIVFAQPFGALIHYATQQSLDNGVDLMSALGKSTRTVVDPGYGTLDILTASGLSVDDDRTKAIGLGQGKLLNEITDQLSQVFNATIGVELVDRGFVTGNLEMFGVEYDFPVNDKTVTEDGSQSMEKYDCLKTIDSYCDKSIKVLSNLVGDAIDIKEFLVCGGPAPDYVRAIKRAFPRHRVTLVPDHRVSVCLGFAQLALQIAASMQKEAVTV